MTNAYVPPRYGKNPAGVPDFSNMVTAPYLISGGVARGPLTPPTDWAAVAAHFAAVGALTWWVTKKPAVALTVGAGAAWALQTNAAKRWFQH